MTLFPCYSRETIFRFWHGLGWGGESLTGSLSSLTLARMKACQGRLLTFEFNILFLNGFMYGLSNYLGIVQSSTRKSLRICTDYTA